MSNTEEYLRTFFTNEISFLADPDQQANAWVLAHGDQFAIKLLVTLESWSAIKDNRAKFKLSDAQFNSIQKLFTMIETFQEAQDYPTSPNQYATLLSNPDWKNIQRYAKELKASFAKT